MSMSTVYVANTLDALRERFEPSDKSGMLGFVSDELKRLGHKPKRFDGYIVSDIGRGRRLAFFSDGSAEQNAILLSVAALVGTKPAIPLRFVYRGNSELSDYAENVLGGVDEAYAFKPRATLEVGKLGCCYGAACVGRTEFVIDFATNGACDGLRVENAEKHVARIGMTVAEECGVELDVEKTTDGMLCVMRYFDTEKSERVLMAIERAALDADDGFGTVHNLIARSACLPVINHALSVDKARYAAGECATEIAPSEECDEFSVILGNTCGCMIFIGTAGERKESAVGAVEFVERLIDMHAA